MTDEPTKDNGKPEEPQELSPQMQKAIKSCRDASPDGFLIVMPSGKFALESRNELVVHLILAAAAGLLEQHSRDMAGRLMAMAQQQKAAQMKKAIDAAARRQR